jgi:hypothetical protein
MGYYYFHNYSNAHGIYNFSFRLCHEKLYPEVLVRWCKGMITSICGLQKMEYQALARPHQTQKVCVSLAEISNMHCILKVLCHDVSGDRY